LAHARRLNPNSDLVFPGVKSGKPLSENTFVKTMRDAGIVTATAHGFRSAFKDWCAEIARARDEVSEAALSHCVTGKVRAAYLRTDFLNERRALMADWDLWLRSGPVPQSNAARRDSRVSV
jgi:integrase